MPTVPGFTVIRTLLVPGAILVVALLGAATLMATSPTLTSGATEAPPTAVRVITVQPQDLQLSVASQGAISPAVQSALVPEVSGQVTWMSPALVPGGRFAAGDVLLRLDGADQTAALERAKAALRRAQAELEHASYERQRLTALQARELTSRSQAENALRLQRISEAAVAEAEVAVRQAERDLQRTALRAPFDGLVRNENVDQGQFITRGAPVATVYAAETLEVRLPLADRQLAYLDLPPAAGGVLPEGQRPEVVLRADYARRSWVWPAEVVRMEAEIDARSRMVQLVAQVLPGSVAPPVGLFVNAEIAGRVADAVVRLPRSALRDGNQVLVLDAEDRLRYRQVEVLRLEQQDALISAGLRAGERVCISQLQTVIDGMRVTPMTDQNAA